MFVINEKFNVDPDLKALVICPKTNKLINIRIADCTFIDVEKKRRVYYIYNLKYVESHTLAELETAAYFLGFDMLDKSNLVNREKIRFLDKSEGEVYFDEVITNDSKKASVARICFDIVTDHLRKINRLEGILKSLRYYKK